MPAGPLALGAEFRASHRTLRPTAPREQVREDSVYAPRVIITNGVVRTMDPSLPTTAALAIAGDRIAGGVGTHETSLPTPDRVDLRGRCVLPAFTDAHVHFPTWSLSQRDVQLEGAASLAETLARV